MDVDRLRDRVRDHLRAHAPELGLRGDAVRVEYVLNWGGFVNHSFHVRDGRRRLHLKLAGDTENQEKLRRWSRVYRRLEERYHAPPLLAWMEVPETGHAGLLFRHLDGATPERLPGARLHEIAAMLRRLHADEELAGEIAALLQGLDADGGLADEIPVEAATCMDTFRETYLRRFAADLAFVRAGLPREVSGEVMDWIEARAAALEADAAASAAFAQPAASPIHADLWADNLLVTPHGDWYVLDWDELGIGDPVIDLVMLTGPTRRHLRAPDLSKVEDAYRLDAAGRERFAVYARAAVLDWILDPLADYVAADVAPEHAAEVRREKIRIHREALAEWRRAFGAAPAA